MRAEKQLLLDEIKEKIEKSKGFVTLNYQTFTAAKARKFRDEIAGLGGEFEVVKKRVFVKAAESAGIQIPADSCRGHVGIVFAQQEEAAALVKATVKFGEENDKAINVLGGHIDGVLCTAADVEAIAKLPGIREMRALVLAVLEAPMSHPVRLLNAVLTSVLYCADERSKKEEIQQ